MPYNKPKIDESKLINNPFANPKFRIHTRPSGAIQYEKYGDMLLPKEVNLEKEANTKVYHLTNIRDLLFIMDSQGRDLFIWLIYTVTVGKDWVWINKELYMDKAKIKSYTTYRKAVDEIITYGIVTPTMYTDTYWINPAVFFCGSRVNKYPNNVVVDGKTNKDKEHEDNSLTE
jgi:hypothetical protein